MKCIDLSGKWAFAWTENPPDLQPASRAELESVGLVFSPCRVPGNLELDMLALGEMTEPYFGMNMLDVRRFEKAHVWYSVCFARPEARVGRINLRMDGVDCFADVHLNGKSLGRCDNMLVEHRFDVTDLLQDRNELLVSMPSPIAESQKYSYPDCLAAGPGQMESLYVRKAPHMYGWDIMPRALSRGLWRPVVLELLPQERISEVFLKTVEVAPSRDFARLRLDYRVEVDGPETCVLRIIGNGRESSFAAEQAVGQADGSVSVEVAEPELWWPRDAGSASLYDVEVSLWRGGEMLDQVSFTHGIRTVSLDREPSTSADEPGQFRLIINGEPIFVRGTNWVPLDAFHSRDAERLPRALELLDDVGCNLVRCWGGNVYESDEFFEFCDRRGIMVWQDFAMACMVYPRDEDFQDRMADEARAVITRLRRHPSLVIWAGDNECDLTWAQGWHGPKMDPSENVLTRMVLPAEVEQYDGTRPYLPSSPYLSPDFIAGRELSLPEDHLWGPRGYYKDEFYEQAACRFVSEIGYHGCPAPESVREFISEDHLWPCTDNKEWQLHATDAIPGVTNNAGRIDLMSRQVALLFGGVPETLERFSQASQICQAEAMKHFVERFRSGRWRRTGIIWWNLLDGWPQFSDAVVDYYFRPKLAYNYIRESQQPVCLMLSEPDVAEQRLVGVNDYLEPVDVEYLVRDVDTGQLLAEGSGAIAANSAATLAAVGAPGKQGFRIIEWQCRGEKHVNHYLAGEPPFDLDMYLAWMHGCYG